MTVEHVEVGRHQDLEKIPLRHADHPHQENMKEVIMVTDTGIVEIEAMIEIVAMAEIEVTTEIVIMTMTVTESENETDIVIVKGFIMKETMVGERILVAERTTIATTIVEGKKRGGTEENMAAATMLQGAKMNGEFQPSSGLLCAQNKNVMKIM